MTSFVYRASPYFVPSWKGFCLFSQPLRPCPIWATNIQTGLLASQWIERLLKLTKTRLCIALEIGTQPPHLSTVMLLPQPQACLENANAGRKEAHYDKPLIRILPTPQAPRFLALSGTVDLRNSCHSLLSS